MQTSKFNTMTMKSCLPLLKYSSLSEKDREAFRALNTQIFGEQLVVRVAEKLKSYPDGLYLSHRDYCGIGLYFFEDKFVIGEVNDGRGPDPVLINFENQGEFTNWLTRQSNQSMSLCTRSSFNNQTITKTRLEYFLEEDYSPVWNSYCLYLNNHRIK